MKFKILIAYVLICVFSVSVSAEVIIDHLSSGPAMHGSTGVTPNWTSYFGEKFTLTSQYKLEAVEFNYIANCAWCTKAPFGEWALSQAESEKVAQSLKTFTVSFFKVDDVGQVSSTPFITRRLTIAPDSYKVAGHSSYITPRNYPFFHGS